MSMAWTTPTPVKICVNKKDKGKALVTTKEQMFYGKRNTLVGGCFINFIK